MTTMTQAQNEALVKLMLVARYQDKKLSLSEEAEFNKHLDSLVWEPSINVSAYALSEIANVRRALGDEASAQRFITAQCAQFQTPELKAHCLSVIEAVLAADTISEQEDNFLKKIQIALQ